MTQAVLEGVGFAIKEVMDKTDTHPESIKINGGGTKSTLWMTILSNILNTKPEIVNDIASPCMGACLLAYKSVNKDIYHDAKKGTIYAPEENIDSIEYFV